MRPVRFFLCIALLIFATSGCGGKGGGTPSLGDNAIPGTASAGLATAICIGAEWPIGGDDNRNATVNVYYRVLGQVTWIQAMDMRRAWTNSLRAAIRPTPGYTLWAGSIFDLTPDTTYEVRLVLTDPDGGSTERILTTTTWKEPELASPSRTLHVAPGAGGGSGTSGDPYLGLAAAQAAAQQGDLIIIHGGQYNGTFIASVSGTEGAPIMWQAAAAETPILDGGGATRVLDIESAQHVIFEGLDVRNGTYAVTIRDSSFVTVRDCNIYNSDFGIEASLSTTPIEHNWISDNTIAGKITWPRTGTQPDERGIKVAGRSIVVCYNRVRGFYDGIDVCDNPPNMDIDIYMNDVSECVDDGSELDFSDYNVRAFRNRFTNCYQGVSFQPSRGGPNYAVRNAMYNIAVEAFKLHTNGVEDTAGAVILHNTIVKHDIPFNVQSADTIHSSMAMNNLFVGDTGSYAFYLSPPLDNWIQDYNVYCGGPFGLFGKLTDVRYDTPADAAAAGIEVHGKYSVGYSGLFVSGVTPPTNPDTQYANTVNDLRPSASNPALDSAVLLPNVNNVYAGSGPDCGCIESGASLPAYGPRP